ncbi:MAG: DNA modification methylase [Victivallaceae bacterium]|nr:DNA modification methylase [Victivallaceae bacterium]
MQIELKNINEIKPYEKNPRINDEAVDAVVTSIREYGFRQPIVMDTDGVIIVGHTRWKAAKKMGLTEVPVHVAVDLQPEKVKAYRLADNKTGEIAEWDYDLLPLELADLQQADFDLSLLGFDADELDKLLNGADAVVEGMTDPDEVPEPPDEPVSKHGEIYQLGNHRLMCGDSTDNANVEALMHGKKANLLLQDPPYNVAYEGGTAEHLTIQNDNMDDAAFFNFLTDAFKCAVEVMNLGASFYIFHADSEGYNFRGACKTAGLQLRECLIWVKDSLVLGRQDYHYQHEPILYGWKDGAAHNWYSDRKQTTVLEFDRPKRSELHPTTKPVEILVYLIKNSSQRGELVADFFGGSGSTLIAAEQTGRKAYLMEIDEKYCDVIRKRWAEFVHGEGCDWQALTPKI